MTTPAVSSRALAPDVDPVRFEVIRNALLAITEEMGATRRRAAYSTNIKTRGDFSCAFFDRDLRTIAQAFAQPSHLGSLAHIVPRAIEAYGADRLAAGDGILINDPYLGGVHLNDITLITPVFHEGALFGYVANIAHHVDVGGGAPGSIGVSSEIYQEGLVIPPVRFVKSGQIDPDLFAMIRSNFRGTREISGDFRAQTAANRLGALRIEALVAQYGAATLAHYLEELLRYTERRTRAAFAEFPDGRFAADMLMDGDMVSMVSGADRRRSYVVDGAPVVTGVVAVGDAWACTNPSLGRGSAMALLHCVRLRELVRAGIHHPVALAAAWDADTRPSTFGPGTKPADRQRFREMEAAIHGVSADPAPAIMDAFGRAVAHDADVFRSLLEIRQVLALPSEVFGRAGFVDRVLEVAAGRQAMPPPGPTRRELLDLIA